MLRGIESFVLVSPFFQQVLCFHRVCRDPLASRIQELLAIVQVAKKLSGLVAKDQKLQNHKPSPFVGLELSILSRFHHPTWLKPFLDLHVGLDNVVSHDIVYRNRVSRRVTQMQVEVSILSRLHYPNLASYQWVLVI